MLCGPARGWLPGVSLEKVPWRMEEAPTWCFGIPELGRAGQARAPNGTVFAAVRSQILETMRLAF